MKQLSNWSRLTAYYLKEFVPTILLAVLIGWAIHTFLFTGSRVVGSSMEPTLQNNDYVFIQRQAKIKRGDVVIFDAPKVDPDNQGQKYYVKRVIGLPGDKIRFDKGKLFVNDKAVAQPYLNEEEAYKGTEAAFGDPWDLSSLSKSSSWNKTSQKTTVVPANSYFVLGDHRSVATDSRYFGYVQKKYMRGRVLVPFWNGSKATKQNVNHSRDHFFDK
ncbi:signal peptidase I [Eupransor demetentiae]|uniref:Signal peptidase I n=1 Tax=Eupransor demetentiae TaxID=3109584 RepID=A0ABP0END3_9LACO|nr:Signal peptidase I (LepB) [Lactobacillaceae bacterium LMG 33000]